MLLCTYNEAENLPKLLQQLAVHLPFADVLVVDDNSPDGTATVVQSQTRFAGTLRSVENAKHLELHGLHGTAAQNNSSAIYLLGRDGKHGLGTATRTGLQWCVQQPYDFVVNLDADLSHDPADAPRLLSACMAESPECDVAVGSRYIAGGGIQGLAVHRRVMSRLLNAYATRLLGLPIKDCSGSYRCYRASSLLGLDFDRLVCPGYGFLEEILVALHRRGAQLCEIPIEFRARSSGHSKLGISDAWGAMAVIHRLAWRR